MSINDDDITTTTGSGAEGTADGGANPDGHDGGADGGASQGEGTADGGFCCAAARSEPASVSRSAASTGVIHGAAPVTATKVASAWGAGS